MTTVKQQQQQQRRQQQQQQQKTAAGKGNGYIPTHRDEAAMDGAPDDLWWIQEELRWV
jgi:hypothetical protein